MVLRKRNQHCIPHIAAEGEYTYRPKCFALGEDWRRCLKPSDRLYAHHTLATARKSTYYKPDPNLIPRDDLDYVLASTYLHNEDALCEPIDAYMQPETFGYPTHKRLKNTTDILPQKQMQEIFAAEATQGEFLTAGNVDGYIKKPSHIPYKYHLTHPVLVGGVVNYKNPSNVRLMNSSHHSPQTNAGYSRQDSDGTFFQY